MAQIAGHRAGVLQLLQHGLTIDQSHRTTIVERLWAGGERRGFADGVLSTRSIPRNAYTITAETGVTILLAHRTADHRCKPVPILRRR